MRRLTNLMPMIGRFHLHRAFSVHILDAKSPSSMLARGVTSPIKDLRVRLATEKSFFRHIDAVPLTACLGAEISGVDLSEKLSEDIVEEIWNSFLLFGVVFFRNQNLSPSQQVELAKRFGEVDRHPIVRGLDENPDVLQIIREAGEQTNFGETWHSDNSYMLEPSLGSILHAVEIPPVGNDTLFSCAYSTYESLSPKLRAVLENLYAVHTAGEAFNPNSVSGGSFDNPESTMKYQKAQELVSHALHPVVRTHPETGRKALFVNSMFTTNFEGMTRKESKPILDFLYEQTGKPEFTCRFRWQTGDVAMWDNRAVQHVAIGDNSSHRRVMNRVTLKGDKPY
eukprot:1385126-Amorphochlora_amoeboformis.AAC.3